jgi:phytoene/squalene synthetase
VTGTVTTDTLSAPVVVEKTEAMEDRLSKSEIRKDALQETVQSVASTVGEVASIVTTAVKDVAGAIGGLATDVFEIRDGVRRADERAEDTAE